MVEADLVAVAKGRMMVVMLYSLMGTRSDEETGLSDGKMKVGMVVE